MLTCFLPVNYFHQNVKFHSGAAGLNCASRLTWQREGSDFFFFFKKETKIVLVGLGWGLQGAKSEQGVAIQNRLSHCSPWSTTTTRTPRRAATLCPD